MMNPAQKRDLWLVPFCEGALILVVSLAALLSKQPLVFTSLGPAAYELIEQPHRKSARPYNVVAGHLIAIAAGFLSLCITHAWRVPAVSTRNIQFPRVEAAVLSAALTVFGTLLARATQPAALSTTLLVSLGTMQRWTDAALIMAAVLLMTLVGEPLRHWREKQIPNERTAQEG
jgi:hypothetical protein